MKKDPGGAGKWGLARGTVGGGVEIPTVTVPATVNLPAPVIKREDGIHKLLEPKCVREIMRQKFMVRIKGG